MTNQTLLTYYGVKPRALNAYIQKFAQRIQASAIGSYFKGYPREQIHATLIGLESFKENQVRYNHNLCMQHKERLPVAFDRVKQVISSHFPMQIQIGGYTKHFKGFKSQGLAPYLRTIRIDTKSLRVAILGWPLNEQIHSKALLAFRQAMQNTCNIAHKYPEDNDFYMVIGELTEDVRSLSPEVISITEDTLREFASRETLKLTVRQSNIIIAEYADSRLPVASTKIWNIEEYLELNH